LISYGDFDYFTGGDNTAHPIDGTSEFLNVVTPMSRVVGHVDVATLNHHGYRDGTNDDFISLLSPRVFVQQSWCSDQPGEAVFLGIISKELYEGERDLFALYTHLETKVTYGDVFVKAYKSMAGHVMVRVEPDGKSFYVFVLKYNNLNNLCVDSQHGPYDSQK